MYSIYKTASTKKHWLSSPDRRKTLGKKDEERHRDRDDTGLSFEVVCSTLGISVSIYYLWFHFIFSSCVIPSFPCIRRTTSFALMSEAELSWLCKEEVKNLLQSQSMPRPAESGQSDSVKSTLPKCVMNHDQFVWNSNLQKNIKSPLNLKHHTDNACIHI